MTSHKFYKLEPKKCLHCGKMGYIKKFCWEHKKGKDNQKEKRKGRFHKAATTIVEEDSSSSDSSSLIVSHALSISTLGEQHTWIIDSGATSHMCHNKKLFTKLFLSLVNVLFQWSAWLLHYSYKMRMINLDSEYTALYGKAFGISMLL